MYATCTESCNSTSSIDLTIRVIAVEGLAQDSAIDGQTSTTILLARLLEYTKPSCRGTPLAQQACLLGPADLLHQVTATPTDLCLHLLPRTTTVGHMMDATRATTTMIGMVATRVATTTRGMIRVATRCTSFAAQINKAQAATTHTVLLRATSRSVRKDHLHHNLGASRITGHSLPDQEGRVKIRTTHDRMMGVGLGCAAVAAIVDVPTRKLLIDQCSTPIATQLQS